MENETIKEKARKEKIKYSLTNVEIERELKEFEKLFEIELNGYKALKNKLTPSKNSLIYLTQIALIHKKLVELINFYQNFCSEAMSCIADKINMNKITKDFDDRDFATYIHSLCDNLSIFLMHDMEEPAKRIEDVINQFIGVLDAEFVTNSNEYLKGVKDNENN